MDCLVTLVVPGSLSPALVAPLVQRLGAHHVERLGECAVDILVVGDPLEARAIALPFADQHGIDAFVQPARGRRKRLLICDMDSTLIEQECIDELAAVHGLKPQVAEITERAMRGELDFTAALTERVALLRGIPEASITDLLSRLITASPGAATLIATAKAAGLRTVLVSGGFTQFAGPAAERLGIDASFANRLIVADGVLTGEVATPILGAAAKAETLAAECAALGVSADDAVAIGDGANDRAMIEAAGLGIAYRPKPILAAVADGIIRHGDLTGVLFAIGVAPDAFVSGDGAA